MNTLVRSSDKRNVIQLQCYVSRLNIANPLISLRGFDFLVLIEILPFPLHQPR